MVITDQERQMNDDTKHDPAHPLRNWQPEPIPRRAPPVSVEIERLAAAAQALADELRVLAERMRL